VGQWWVTLKTLGESVVGVIEKSLEMNMTFWNLKLTMNFDI
jgi:hypothetical protein